jgi:hypothetical protein
MNEQWETKGGFLWFVCLNFLKIYTIKKFAFWLIFKRASPSSSRPYNRTAQRFSSPPHYPGRVKQLLRGRRQKAYE